MLSLVQMDSFKIRLGNRPPPPVPAPVAGKLVFMVFATCAMLHMYHIPVSGAVDIMGCIHCDPQLPADGAAVRTGVHHCP